MLQIAWNGEKIDILEHLPPPPPRDPQKMLCQIMKIKKNQIAWIGEKIWKIRFWNFYTNKNKIAGRLDSILDKKIPVVLDLTF